MRVLHVPFHFTASRLGGTEIYVSALCEELRSIGIDSRIAAPGPTDEASTYRGTEVYQFAMDPDTGFEHAYGAPDKVAARSFRDLLADVQPTIVHLHAKSSAVSLLLLEEARRANCKVVYTYHTPTGSCARGTLMYMGRSVCDGEMQARRCAACALQAHGVPSLLAQALAVVPKSIGGMLASAQREGGVWTSLRMTALIDQEHDRFRQLLREVDRVVAVCDWVADVLRRNGVEEDKLVVSRQGLPYRAAVGRNGVHRNAAKPMRVGFFGRMHSSKGIDVLVRAVRALPDCPLALDIHAIPQTGNERYGSETTALARGDERIRWLPPCEPSQVVEAMRACDLIAVPSQWLETGPLVVLEAFAAGTPVLASRLGGLAEIVRDGVDGVLVDAWGSPDAWASALRDLAHDPARLVALRSQIQPQRTVAEVAADMMQIYRRLH